MAEKIPHYEAVLLVADRPTSSGRIYPAEELRKMHDGKTLFWEEETKELWYRGPMWNSGPVSIICRGPDDAGL